MGFIIVIIFCDVCSAPCTQSSLCSLQCLSAYAKALQLNPLNRTAALKMAEVLTAQGKEEEAAAWCVF